MFNIVGGANIFVSLLVTISKKSGLNHHCDENLA
jgi:hypothetical protein